MEGDKGPVCVTGGTGYVASWLIMRLLEHGYSVHTTTRFHPGNKKDISYLTSLPGAPEKLKIFHADLNNPESFNAAIEGCTGVFHLAHPVDLTRREPAETVTKRTVEGTLGILRACLDAKTVKRVVYTSSSVAVMFNHKDQGVTDESIWTDVGFYESLKIMGGAYVAAKTKTEMVAWEFAERNGLDVVSLVPSLVVGPFICPSVPASVYMGMAMILGKQEYYRTLVNSNMVHVDDLASAHIFLLECPDAKGRYICSSDEISIHKLSEFLSAKYPEFQIPKADILDKVEAYRPPSLSTMKLLNSGFKYKYGLDEMFDGAIRCCREKGFLS